MFITSKIRHLSVIVTLFLSLLVTLISPLASAKIANTSLEGIVVFGDSLSDNGNFYKIKNGSVLGWPYYFGRCSNGLVWVEILTHRLYLLPDQLNDLAIAGAQTSGSHPAGVTTQVARYVKQYPRLDPHKLYIIWAGGNNYLYHPYSRTRRVNNAINDINASITQLANHGARYFLIPNLPDMGETPLAANLQRKHPHLKWQANLTKLTHEHNQKLLTDLPTLQKKLNNHVFIMEMDVYSMMQSAEVNPKKFGLVNINQPCYYSAKLFQGGGIACKTPNQYLFWDVVHPTLIGHKMLAALAMQTLEQNGLARNAT